MRSMERTRYSLNGSWEYQVNRKDMGLIQVPFSAHCVGESACALTFDCPELPPRCALCFEGITYRAQVTLNGASLGEMVPYSFYAFDVTSLIKRTGNRLVVTLQDMNLPFGPSEGWENYGGIIREVYLLATDAVYVDDIVWRTALDEDFAGAEAEIQVLLGGGEGDAEAELTDAHGFRVAWGRGETAEGAVTLRLHVDRPNLWSPEQPYLYTLTVRCGEDEVTQQVGFKSFTISGQRFCLNGKPLYLKGVCRHDMWGEQGHTLTRRQMEQDMRMIKATGCNFVRLVHYPHHRYILDLADQLGLMVSEEPGLWWSDMHNPETTQGALEVMERVVRRDRNRVCVAFWLAFNECVFTPEFLRDSAAVCKRLDPTRPVSGANCMNIKMTKELFIENGFDFYTMHPYGVELNQVCGGVDGLTSLDEILDTLCDKPLVFTEWGGLYVFENQKLFARFQRYMLDAFKHPDGGRVLAGSCYWVFADMYEYGRGEHACFDGILHEGLVDVDRVPRGNLDVFAKLMNGMEIETEPQHAAEAAPLTLRAEAARPLDIWQGRDMKAQAQLYAKLLSDSTVQQGFHQKPQRRLTHGPALHQAYARIGDLPVDLRQGQPLVVADEAVISVGRRVRRLMFLGNVSMPYGYPAYGERGVLAAEYVLVYADGSTESIPLRNGIELTTALGILGPSAFCPPRPR